jgi:hypothetical protein
LHRLFDDKFEVDKVGRLLQNDDALTALKSADDPNAVIQTWQAPLQEFKQLREKYLMYN